MTEAEHMEAVSREQAVPLVRMFPEDGPEERRRALRLEEVTRQALENWRDEGARRDRAEALLAEAVGALTEQAWDWRNTASLPPDDEISRVLRMCAEDLDAVLAKIVGGK